MTINTARNARHPATGGMRAVDLQILQLETHEDRLTAERLRQRQRRLANRSGRRHYQEAYFG